MRARLRRAFGGQARVHEGGKASATDFRTADDCHWILFPAERHGQLAVAAADIKNSNAGMILEQIEDGYFLDLQHPGANRAGKPPGIIIGRGFDIRRLGKLVRNVMRRNHGQRSPLFHHVIKREGHQGITGLIGVDPARLHVDRIVIECDVKVNQGDI